MLPGATAYNSAPLLPILLAASSRPLFCAAVPWTGLLSRRQLILDYGPAPPPDQGPPASADALRDPAFLPAQIGAIVGAYALCLVIVALLLLAFSKRRRERIRNRDLPPNAELYLDFNPFPDPFLLQSEEEYKRQLEEFQSEQYQHEQYQHEQYQHEQYQHEHYQHLHEQYPHEQFQNHRFSIQQVALQPASLQQVAFQKLSLQTDFPGSPARNFSLPASASPLSPTRTGPFPFSTTKSHHSAFTTSSPTSTILAPGIDLSVDQSVVHRDRTMAQQQLEEMYKHVMEQEQAKLEGREYHAPTLASPASNSVSASPAKAGGLKKERNKPSNLNLARDDKAESRGSSIFSFLKSPRKNKAGGMTISSPIMTPMSGTFPRGHHDDQELNAMAPRYYAPPAAPPAQSDLPFRRVAAAGSTAGGSSHLPTPDMSPISTQSIDSRIDAAIVGHPPPPRTSRREPRSDDRLPSHSRDVSTATSSTNGNEPVSAGSERSTSHLVGLPLSPRPGVNRFPSLDSLPASPRPGQQTFAFPAIPAGNPPNNMSTTSIPRSGSAAPSGYSATAVRTGGALPLRAYETAAAQPSSLTSPTAVSFAAAPTKQTVFTRGPMSPGGPQTAGLRTPWTGAPVPYTPYQPFSPVVPITPTVVTRADRKRMKKFEPKTPTVEMVRDEEDVW